MSPEIEKALTGALLVLIPAFAAWAAARLDKAKKDINAAFLKLRAHEQQIGIETHVSGGRCHVTSRDPTKIVSSSGPEPLGSENSREDR